MSKAQDIKNTDNSSTSKASAFITKIIIISLGISTIIISTHAFVFYIFAILPAIVALVTDRRSSKAASNTVTAFNLIGLFPYLIQFWHSSSDAAGYMAQSFMANIDIWFRIYVFAAIGWIYIWALPTITGYIFILRIERKIKKLKILQSNLVDEWGIKIKHE